jgi:hypothetical protein
MLYFIVNFLHIKAKINPWASIKTYKDYISQTITMKVVSVVGSLHLNSASPTSWLGGFGQFTEPL